MKKQLLLSIIFTLFCGMIYGQHLIRVNNDPAADADYTTLQAANDNAINGDTIYVEGSTTSYNDDANISKKLTIIGPGYFLTDNDSTQANGLQATFNGDINFNAGSAGSFIAGIYCYQIMINVNDVSVTRCHADRIRNGADVENILISQNYVTYIDNYSGKISNSVISNNIADNIDFGSTSGSLIITNNTIEGMYYDHSISAYNSSITNNIVSYSTGQIPENTGNVITNNILASSGTNANGNQYNVVMANVFVDYSGSLDYSDDAKWKLKTGSPALGAGVAGVDCGAFGGSTPYVLSGIPPLPHIYEAAIPGVGYTGTGLSCTLKVKAGK